MRTTQAGWSQSGVLACFGCTGLLLVAFVAAEGVEPAPMLDIALFRKRTFAGSSIAAFGLSAAVLGPFMFLVLYLFDDLGYSLLTISLRLLLLTGMTVPFLPVAWWLDRHVPVRSLICGGLGLGGGRSVVDQQAFTDQHVDQPGAWLGPGWRRPRARKPPLGVRCRGSCQARSSCRLVKDSSTMRQVGAATGVAVLGSVFSTRLDDGITKGLAGIPQLADQVPRIASLVMQGRTAQAVRLAGPAARANVLPVVRQSFANAMHEVLLVAAGVALVSAALALLVRSRDVPRPAGPTPRRHSSANNRGTHTPALGETAKAQVPPTKSAARTGAPDTARTGAPDTARTGAPDTARTGAPEAAGTGGPGGAGTGAPGGGSRVAPPLTWAQAVAIVRLAVSAQAGTARTTSQAAGTAPCSPADDRAAADAADVRALDTIVQATNSNLSGATETANNSLAGAAKNPAGAAKNLPPTLAETVNNSPTVTFTAITGAASTTAVAEAANGAAENLLMSSWKALASLLEADGPRAPRAEVVGPQAHPRDEDVVDLARAFGCVRGQVTAATGEPVAGATVTLVDATGDEAGCVVAGKDGCFSLVNVSEGNYTLVAAAPHYKPAANNVALQDGGADARVSLAGIGSLVGQVTRARDGAPLVGEVEVSGQGDTLTVVGTTDHDGHFRFPEMMEGSYTARVRSAGYREEALPVVITRGAAWRADIALVGQAHLYGAVSGAKGEWVPGARVTLVDVSGTVVGGTVTDGAGSYVLPEVPEGPYTVMVACDRGSASIDVELEAGAAVLADLTLGAP